MEKSQRRLRLPLDTGEQIASELKKLYRAVKVGAIAPADAANMAAILAVLAGL